MVEEAEADVEADGAAEVAATTYAPALVLNPSSARGERDRDHQID